MHKRIFFIAGLMIMLLASITSCTQLSKEVVSTFENGNPKLVKTYRIKSGNKVLIKEVEFYKNGQKKYEGSYNGEVKEGRWTFWFEDGSVWSDGFFSNGLRSGKAKVFHENGKPFYQGQYTGGKKDGEWVFYDDQGKEVNRVTFSKGELIKQSPLNQGEVKKDSIQ